MTIPQMVADVHMGKMPRHRLIAALGISTIGVGAVVAASEQRPSPKVLPHVQQNANEQQHIRLHNQNIASQGNTEALQNDYAEHAVVEDSMYLAALVGRKAIMERVWMDMAAIPDNSIHIAITNQLAHGNQISAVMGSYRHA